jgi:hypothetical protein
MSIAKTSAIPGVALSLWCTSDVAGASAQDSAGRPVERVQLAQVQPSSTPRGWSATLISDDLSYP